MNVEIDIRMMLHCFSTYCFLKFIVEIRVEGLKLFLHRIKRTYTKIHMNHQFPSIDMGF